MDIELIIFFIMLTFKEIDERISHYEEELEWCADLVKDIGTSLKMTASNEDAVSLETKKMKIEFFCFVTTSYIDLLCIYKSCKRAKSNWEKFFNLKFAYLIIYETINTYHKYKGEIYKTVNKEQKDKYESFFRMLNDELSEFKEAYDYENIMPKIRNKSTAHYDRNFLDYYGSYEILSSSDTKDIIRSFLYFINPLHYFTYGLLEGKIDEFLFVNSWLS